MVVVDKEVEIEEAVTLTAFLQLREWRHRRVKYLALGSPGIGVRDWVCNSQRRYDWEVSNWCWLLGTAVEVAGGEDWPDPAWRSLEVMLSHSPVRAPWGNDIGWGCSPQTLFAPRLLEEFWKAMCPLKSTLKAGTQHVLLISFKSYKSCKTQWLAFCKSLFKMHVKDSYWYQLLDIILMDLANSGWNSLNWKGHIVSFFLWNNISIPFPCNLKIV